MTALVDEGKNAFVISAAFWPTDTFVAPAHAHSNVTRRTHPARRHPRHRAEGMPSAAREARPDHARRPASFSSCRRRYEDRRHLKAGERGAGGPVDHGEGTNPLRSRVRSRWRGGRSVFEIMVGAASVTQKCDLVRGMWFNQGGRAKTHTEGRELFMYGKLGRSKTGTWVMMQSRNRNDRTTTRSRTSTSTGSRRFTTSPKA